MKFFFHIVLYQPLLNILIFLYEHVTFQDLGIAIILLTIIIRSALYPLFYKSLKHQSVMQRIQPHVKKIQETHKGDKEKQATALLALYKEHKVNPFSGFFLILIQLPILIALYRVFLNGFSPTVFQDLYSFIHAPVEMHSLSLGLIDLTARNILIVVLAAIAQYFQGRIAIKKRAKGQGEGTPAEKIGKQMVFMGPILTLAILSSLPSAIGLYWLTTSIFSLFQQILVERSLDRERNLEKVDAKLHDGKTTTTT